MTDKPKKSKPGPDPERLKIEGDWEEAAKKAMQKKRPPEGWPNPDDEGQDDARKEKGQQDD